MSPLKLALVAAGALTLTACAAGPPPGGPDRGPGRGPEPREYGPSAPRRQIFISPAGEPFRADGQAPYPVAAWFSGADADHDGVLSRTEFVADARRFFAVLDSNQDAVIDGPEVSNYESRIAPEILGSIAPASIGGARPPRGPGGGDGPGDGPRGGGRGRGLVGGALQGAAPYGLIAEPQPVMGADADFNRRITRDEAERAAKARFALLDQDGDAVLRLADLPRTLVQAAAEGRGSRRGLGRQGGHRPPPPR